MVENHSIEFCYLSDLLEEVGISSEWDFSEVGMMLSHFLNYQEGDVLFPIESVEMIQKYLLEGARSNNPSLFQERLFIERRKNHPTLEEAFRDLKVKFICVDILE